MTREQTLVNKLLRGTDMHVTERPSYIRISGPVASIAYGFYRSDGSLRLQIRRADGRYPEKVLVEGDTDLPIARERLEKAEREISRVKTASIR